MIFDLWDTLALWPSVTVMLQSFCDSSVASGRPTTLLRPSTTASAT